MLATKNLHTDSYEVIHPLFDVHEEKMTGADLGKIKLTPTVKFSLFLLRMYIIVMGLLLIYHVLDLAGVFGHHAK